MFDDDVMGRRSVLTKLQRSKLPLWFALLLVVIAVVATYQVSQFVFSRHAAQERAALSAPDSQTAAMQAQGQEALRRQVEELQLLSGTALAWAVRAAMMRNNLGQVEQYFAEFAKPPSVQLALLSDRTGKVLVASDRRFHGTRFSTHFPERLSKADEVTLERVSEKEVRLILPIQGLTKRLGTVVLIYATR